MGIYSLPDGYNFTSPGCRHKNVYITIYGVSLFRYFIYSTLNQSTILHKHLYQLKITEFCFTPSLLASSMYFATERIQSSLVSVHSPTLRKRSIIVSCVPQKEEIHLQSHRFSCTLNGLLILLHHSFPIQPFHITFKTRGTCSKSN